MILRASRVTKKKRNLLLKSFCLDQTATVAASLAKVNRRTANLYFRHWRELIFQATRRAPRFSGEIEMDQAFFLGRGRKRETALVRRLAGLPPLERIVEARKIRKDARKLQVFAIQQRGGDVYAQIVHSADARTLMPIIRLVVEQGSVIYTDEWRAFSGLGMDGYTHGTVNHSLRYTDRKGTHVNSVESFFSFARRRLAKFNGISRRMFPLHLKECEFRWNHKDMSAVMKILEKAAR